MWKEAQGLLEAAGYALREGDAALLQLCAEYAEAGLLCDCNTGVLSPALEKAGAVRTVGAFLSVKQKFLPDDLVDFAVTGAVERLRLGDADVTFSESARSAAEKSMASLIAGLLHYGQGLVACERRVRW